VSTRRLLRLAPEGRMWFAPSPKCAGNVGLDRAFDRDCGTRAV
jgi:hypothetical protein